MAMGLYLSGDLHHAEEMYKELLNNASLDTVPHLEVLIHLVFISSQYGHIRESDNYFEQALKSLPAIADELLRKTYHAWLMLYHGFRHSITGDQFRAIALADDAGRILQGIGSYRLLTLACQLKSLACIFLGSHEKGFGEARRGILISNEKGFRDFTYGWLLCHAGHHSIFLGRSEEALLYAEKGLRHFQTLGSPFGEAYAYYIMEYIYLVMGDMDRAEEMGHASLNAAKG
jgi:tetratricopeptide (TPR) repeat protein